MFPLSNARPLIPIGPPKPSNDAEDDISYSYSGTIPLSAFSPPIRALNPLVPLFVIQPNQTTPTRTSTPRLISIVHPLTPHSHSRFIQQSTPPDNRAADGRSCSPAPSSSGSLTVRPAILGSNQSTLKPLVPALLSPWVMGGDEDGNVGGQTWQETDSRTARQPERPRWIGSLGEVKMVDELEVEMCVLCGRAMRRSEVEVKEFELGGAAAGLQTGSAGVEERGAVGGGSGSGTLEASVDVMMDGLGLGLGRWMVCRDTAACDAAVEDAVFADDEDE